MSSLHRKLSSRAERAVAGAVEGAFVFLLCLLLLAPFAFAAKKKPIQTFIRPDQTFEIPNAATTFATATRGCANDAWAAAVATTLAQQQIQLPPRDWSLKLAGGDACLSMLPPLEALRKSVEGNYSLGNGLRIRIALTAAQGAPNAADPLAVDLTAGRALIVIYKGQPLLLYGMTYDEHIINNLRKELWIKELRLVNPAAKVGSPERTVTIKREEGTASDIEMMIRVDAISMQLGQLEPH
jgi:hypothetical protein